MTSAEESKIRSLIQTIIAKELKSELGSIEKKIENSIKDNEKSQKKDFLDIFKKEIELLNKKVLSKDETIDLMAKAFVKQHKFMWEKSKFITSYLKEL